MNPLLLGCIADDFTGATDLANNLVRAGMRVVQTIGVPEQPITGATDAIVVALKSRTIPATDAAEQSLIALRWLQAQGARQFYFKYCSTFDSTDQGNIGPVTEALMDALGCEFTICTPAFPDNGRTVVMGHLFVGRTLLNESGLQHHPLTPMRDANLVRVLQAQCARRVGLIDHREVAGGPEAVAAAIRRLRAEGVGIAIVDALSNEDLHRIAPAVKTLPLLTAASGLAIALPANSGLQPSPAAATLPPAAGLRAIVSGSCSSATQRQIAAFVRAGRPAFAIDALQLAAGVDMAAEAIAWARPRLQREPVLIHSNSDPTAVVAAQHQLGAAAAGDLVERTLASIARRLVAEGVGQLVVAGGETSGACVQALGITHMRIGPQIAPGVPWCHTGRLHLALKSGNFGADEFFLEAFEVLNA